MYKYFEIEEENLSFLTELKEAEGIKSDKAAINYIIKKYSELYKKKEAEGNSPEVAKAVMNQFNEQYGTIIRKLIAILSAIDENSTIMLDVMNTYLMKDNMESCILNDVISSPVIDRSRDYYHHKISKAKQKKDNNRKVL